jgi:mannonate dehydratase
VGFEQSWRWFGPNDSVSLKEIKQTGASGIVSALHQIPTGEIWPVEEIMKRKNIIESEGFKWTVVESVPVHENIKKRKSNYKQLVENYKKTIRNLGKCGIDTVCYNFMPVLDWSRTDLKVEFKDGSITTKFEAKAFAAFDIFILKRPDAEKSYSAEQIKKARQYIESIDDIQKKKLKDTVLLGLPGSLETYTLEEFKSALSEYNDIDEKALRENLNFFIKEIIPAAEEAGVFMVIHADDPPWSLLGLPRVVSTKQDVEHLLTAVDSPFNGLTLCTGSFGASVNNNLIDMAESFADRINFVHLRNVKRNNHLEGDIDIYEVMKILLAEQRRRVNEGRKDIRLPMRPDHGHLMIPDLQKQGIYPGYSLFGRMRALSELRGMEIGIIRSLGL